MVDMRVLLIMMKMVGISVLGLLAIFLIGREGVLQWERYSLQKQIETIQQISRVPHDFSRYCGGGTAGRIVGTQLRFLDATRYQLELFCSEQPDQPVQIRAGSLGMGVQKTAGSSGVYLSTAEEKWHSGVTLSFLGRTSTIQLGSASNSKQDLSTELGNLDRPKTSCDGFGYRCCNLNTEVIDGDVVGDLSTDCPLSCASVCLSRPLVLSFNAQPSFHSQERVVRLSKSATTVEFAFTANDPDGFIESAVLKFGDGEEHWFEETSAGRVSHEYTCALRTCEFTAMLELIDDQEITSPALPINEIRVLIE